MIQYFVFKDNKIEVNFCYKLGFLIFILFIIYVEGIRYFGIYYSVEEFVVFCKVLKWVIEKVELRVYWFQVLFDILFEMVFIVDK